MPFDLGSIVAHIKADVTGFKQGLSEAQKSLGGFKDNIASGAAAIQDFSAKANMVAGVAIAAVGFSLNKASEDAMEFEKAMISLDIIAERFGASGKKAQKAAQDLGTELRIGVGPAANGLQNLLKSGLNLEQSTELMRRFTNEAITGKSKSIDLATAVENLSFAFATGNSALGNMSGISENWSDITSKGADILKGWNGTVNESVGITKEVAKQLTDYEGQLKKQGKTLSATNDDQAKYVGLLALTNLTMGSAARFTGTLVDTNAQLDLKLQTLSVTIGQKINPAINAMKVALLNSGILDGIMRLVEGFEALGILLSGGGYNTKLAEVFGIDPLMAAQIINFVNGLKVAFEQFSAFVVANKEIIFTFIQGLVVGIGGLMIIGNIISLIALLTNPITLVILAIAALYTAYQTNFMGIQDTTNTVVTALTGFFNTYLLPVILAVTEFIKSHWNEIMMVTAAVWNTIKLVIELALAVIQSLFVAKFGWMIEYYKAHGEEIKAVWDNIWKVISGIFMVALGIIQAIIGVFIGLLTGDWERAHQILKQAAETAWNGIKSIFSGVWSFISGWGNQVKDALIRPFAEAWSRISEFVSKIKDALDFTKRHSPSVLDIVDKGVRLVNNALDGLAMPGNVAMASAPGTAAAIGGAMAGNQMFAITVPMDGAIISDQQGAQRMGEIVGDAIITKLKTQIRF